MNGTQFPTRALTPDENPIYLILGVLVDWLSFASEATLTLLRKNGNAVGVRIVLYEKSPQRLQRGKHCCPNYALLRGPRAPSSGSHSCGFVLMM